MEQLKKKKLRHTEYYDIQDLQDRLYQRSKNGNNFYNLIELMSSEENIRLAFRNIKRNKGSKTAGTDGLTISDISNLDIKEVTNKIQSMVDNYKPQSVRRVLIPKANGKTRPLGIPTIWDRLLQQCILQILDPICEAKFHNHSYGFRPNRSTHHALARMKSLINIGGFYHCIDIDIKGFFDNVNHGKLLKQIWSLGIRDKKLMKIISLLLKSEIDKEGKPSKGTPQGGILSPLLSNIVLNELDWWVSDQWETFNSKVKYSATRAMRLALKQTKLKEVYIIRYADDFKILCKTRQQAIKMYHAVKQFLNERLHLEISPDKSKVINLKKSHSEFLGFKIKAKEKGATKFGYVAQSNMTDKAIQNAKTTLANKIKAIQKKPERSTVYDFNSTVIGIQNYYNRATNITIDLSKINFSVHKVLYNRLKDKRTIAIKDDMSPSMKKRYKGYDPQLYKIQDMVFVPIHAQKHVKCMNFSQDICNYTVEGREKIHSKLKFDSSMITHIMRNYIPNRSIEYNDNRISKFLAQYGKCAITKTELGYNNWQCHHIVPYHISKDDSYQNLIILHEDIHKLIHMIDMVKIKSIVAKHQVDKKDFDKINQLRKKAHIKEINLKELLKVQ